MLNAVHLKVTEESKLQAFSETFLYYKTDITELVQKAADGDYEAYGEIYTAFLDRIFRYVFYQVKDKMIAEDLTEEIFIKAWRAISSYKGKRQSFSTWLYRIAHNHVIDYFRSNHHNESLAMEGFDNMDILGNVIDPEQEAEKYWIQQELSELISCLPSQQKQVVILKFIECLDNREIEQIVGKSQGAIRIMQMRALATLQQKLSKEEQGT